MTDGYSDLPIVYSCSGCSSAAQMANDIAITLDREKIAEMSCIAGVGGDVPSLVDTATADREVVAIDGCPIECTKACLDKHGVDPEKHYQLTQEGVAKEFHADYDDEEFAEVLDEIAADLGHESAELA